MYNTMAESKPSRGGWKSALFIIFVEMAERFAFYGVSANLINYLTNVLGQATATAAKNVNIWQGVSAMAPLVGGFIADSYMGKFKTILLSTTIYLMGLILLTITVSAIPIPHNQKTLFFISLYILSIGEGGHKPCVQTFAADQFDEDLPEEKAKKSSFFNWWFVGIVFGATAAVLVVIYVQDNVGWRFGFSMLAVAVAVALFVFLLGAPTYRREPPAGSPLTRVAQVVVAAVRKRRSAEDKCRGIYHDPGDRVGMRSHSLARTSQLRFLDKATMIDDIDASTRERNPWRLCSVTQVEEVKLVFQLIPIWFSCVMYAVVIAQHSTYFTKQGNTLIRSIGPKFQIPAPSFQVVTGLTILTSVLVYERVLVPFSRKISGHPSGITMLQRIGFGLFTITITMIVSASVETRRVKVAQQKGLIDSPKSIVPMSIAWLIPQYILTGISDVFAIIGMQELFYDQMPIGMRSMGAAAYLSIVGVGNFVSSIVISIAQGISKRAGNEWLGNNINRAHLNDFYWVLAGLSFLNLIGYIWISRRFVYKKIEAHGDDQGNGKEIDVETYPHGKM